ncbi:MAG: N-6 DNA methylase [Candidatus Angelobacter sp.]
MPEKPSLDELISSKAVEFSHRVSSIAAFATKEEEIRIETEKQLAFIQKEAGITLEGKHEFTVASGRVDSVYDRVIIEYKNPSNSASRIGPKADCPGAKEVTAQIIKRFYDLRQEHGQALNSMFGVGLDGNFFIFVRYRDDKWEVQNPVPVNKHSSERFLWALFNLGRKGKSFTPENLAVDFGSESKLAQEGVRTLYQSVLSSSHPKVTTFFNQWKILFGEVAGYDVEDPSDRMSVLATSYGVEGKTPKAAELLFGVHTYYALFMKLLASEIVAFFHSLPTPLKKMLKATTSNKLKGEIEDLESGSIFVHFNITNFLEGDLFAWYLSAWDEPIEKLVRDMVARLDDYNPGTLSEDPSGSRDLLKKLYQQLLPKSVRHDLGEYYTPDWLVEHVLENAEYTGDPDKRLLDPACGSGTFLIMAINAVRNWYDADRESRQFDEGELCKKILTNIVGFDLNPIAVMAARTNYLISIRDLIGRVDRVEIPIYLCDSVSTPSEYGGGLFKGKFGTAKAFKTAVANFLVPSEIAESREDLSRYAEQLEFCVKNEYSPDEFISRCKDEGLAIAAESLHADLYSELVALDKANKNGVWARIIKNAFAPLFVGRFDFVVGNPPWVNWRNLPTEYRKTIGPLWVEYGLFSKRGLEARLGGGMDDISVLMTYVASDVYLHPGATLAFVITQTIFQSAGGGQGFRRFVLPGSKFLKIAKVFDFTNFQPFEGATNRTATFVALVSEAPTTYPVPYFRMCIPAGKAAPRQEDRLGDFDLDLIRLEATPVSADSTSSWSILPPGTSGIVSKVRGVSPYNARIGVHSGGAAGVFWVDVIKTTGKSALISNRHDIGRNKFEHVTVSIESELLKPLIRGRDLDRWKVVPSLHIVMPYEPENDGKAISEAGMKKYFPKTFAYFNRFRAQMIKRAHYIQHFKPSGQPFWSMYNVGNYTFAPAHVLWREQSAHFRCAVLGSNSGPPCIADHKLIVVACGSSAEAHYIAAVLNSSPARFVIESYMVNVQISTHVLKNVNLQPFSPDDALHTKLAKQSVLCHELAASESSGLSDAEMGLDHLAAELWGISEKQLHQLREYLKNNDVIFNEDIED